jgi:phospholipid N-methyltransferase
MNHSATYSPEDNKLRLYPAHRLDKEEYERVKAAGFIWAPKQELFVAPMWTPSREDFLIEMCGEIEDEDKSLVERSEERAERFEDYSERRGQDADRAHATVSAIADNIPLGQPILVGHHSEKHARKDAERITKGMRKAIKCFEESKYWKSRAAGAIRAAKYKERPDVRARRIKGLEADKRKQEKNKAEAEKLFKFWNEMSMKVDREMVLKVCNNFDHGDVRLSDGSTTWSAWSALTKGTATVEEIRTQRLESLPRIIAYNNRWITHIENRLTYEKAMMEESGGTATDQKGPEKGGACKCWASPRNGWSYIQKVNKVSVTVWDNWGNGGRDFNRIIPFDKLKKIMTAAEVQAARDTGMLVEVDKTGFLLRNDIDALKPKQSYAAPEPTKFDALKDTLEAGIKVVVAPQLFPTPPEIAGRMVDLAEIETAHTVLEPSAGTGALTWAILQAHQVAALVAIEINLNLVDNLRASSGFEEERTSNRVIGTDFLTCNGNLGTFDRILMNPPFQQGQDIKHIQHALTFLKPGGRLVALCANGPRQREAFKSMASYWEDLPAGSFKDQGTGVNVALMVIDRKEAQTP